ncbi:MULTISPECIES: hypothetical protein [Prochlorococcus]|uniref:hypothetical protein n=1 Tax=Prochlorococcus TaxID=1218 RepID=UPI00053379D1|nr:MULTISPECIES: hypothetical protein [Prochlorococcus]KGG13352.1 hypothetical protein EV05_1032 [Prochlorococcus sp. MIT 0601]
MPDSSVRAFHLKVMQDALPMGMAVVERVRKGGIQKVMEVFQSAKEPFAELKMEGDLAAGVVRQQLDNVSPGLGNPVKEVKISVEEVALEEKTPLMPILLRIEERLDLLKAYLDENNNS